MTTTTNPVMTEDLPSSGNQPCQHTWQVVESTETEMVLVCSKANCNASKRVPKPKVTESKSERPVLLG
jgi:hypothetical protein